MVLVKFLMLICHGLCSFLEGRFSFVPLTGEHYNSKDAGTQCGGARLVLSCHMKTWNMALEFSVEKMSIVLSCVMDP